MIAKDLDAANALVVENLAVGRLKFTPVVLVAFVAG